MKQSVVHIPSFQGEYKTGLIFSMIEGLRPGESFKLVCDHEPDELSILLKEAQVPQLQWEQKKVGAQWELLIQKTFNLDNQSVGCCGMCAKTINGQEKE
ncbi:MAG: DUF2249 domain-containing protein [Bdellovibrionaceae bacterium]|nr:DUF2249 domain-containing protein [Pseudobdellovibrionaceae bacterium]